MEATPRPTGELPRLSGDQRALIQKDLASTPPAAVERLMGDMKMIAAYEAASDWQEDAAMKKAFSSLSWDDPHVLKGLAGYLQSSGQERARVDYAYNALFPRPVDTRDAKQAMMSLWLKSRLFYCDQRFPFQFSPF